MLLDRDMDFDLESHDRTAFIDANCSAGNIVFNLWSPTVTGDLVTDIALGQKYADATIEIARLQGSSEFVARVLAALARKQSIGPVEASFLIAIARRAYVGSHN